MDAGIEAMLCCWLQHLQELGGPDVDKPDLLKGSVGSLRNQVKNTGSTGSLRGLFVDPRARYNVSNMLFSFSNGLSCGLRKIWTVVNIDESDSKHRHS